jgi:GDP-L-fucose synthase
MPDFNCDSKIYIAGHLGLVGSACVRLLKHRGFRNLLLQTRAELDLTNECAVLGFFERVRPDYVIIAAAKVGGIAANMAAPVDYLVENLRIQNNILLACQAYDVIKTIFLGSSCIYPRECPQPIREDYFMTGPLEPTNESYAVAKIAGIRLAQALRDQAGMNIICPMPCNVYGVGDHFGFERSHVLSALVRRMAEAKRNDHSIVTLWGSGIARREFLHVDDLADALLYLVNNYDSPDIINVGSGEDVSIFELANKIAAIVGYGGKIEWDLSKPDGMPRKLLDVSRLHALGWKHQIDLEIGIRSVVADFESRYPLGSKEMS